MFRRGFLASLFGSLFGGMAVSTSAAEKEKPQPTGSDPQRSFVKIGGVDPFGSTAIVNLSHVTSVRLCSAPDGRTSVMVYTTDTNYSFMADENPAFMQAIESRVL